MSQLRNIVITQQETITARYIKAAYIAMPPESYIKTEIYAYPDKTKSEFNVKAIDAFATDSTIRGLYGARANTGATSYAVFGRAGSYKPRWDNTGSTSIGSTWTNGVWHKVLLTQTAEGYGKTIVDDGVEEFIGSLEMSSSSSGKVYINTLWNNNMPYASGGSQAWAWGEVRIWQDGEHLSGDFVPVYDTLTKEAGMYDKVSGTFFGNDGTGTIKAYDENNNLISDYTILDYCYFSTSPVITDIKPKSTWTDLKLSIMPKSSSSNPYALCARTSSSSTDKLEIRTYFTTSKFNVVIGANSTVYPSVQDLTAKSDIDIDGTDIKITNSGVTTTTSVGSTPGFVNCDYPICIGGLKDGNTMSSSYKMTGYFYGMQVYDNNVLAHNIVPAKNYLNEVCLYNTVTKKAYYPVSGTLLEDAPLVNDGVFKFTVDTTKTGNNNYFSVTGATYTTDWGDGTTSSGYNHSYSTPGTYQVTITFQNPTAAFSEFKINNGRLISVDTPFPTGTTTYWTYQVLAYTGNLQSVHKDLFIFNPQLTEPQEMFAYSGIQTIPAGIFDPLVNVTWFDNIFTGSSIKTLPAGIFDKMTSMNRASNLFQDCANLETVPDGLFAKNLLLKQFSNTFKNCTKLKLNKNIFCIEDTEKTTRFMTGSQSCSFSNVFNRTEYTGTEQGEAPALWDYTFSTLGSHNTCYSGAGNSATSISNYSSIPSDWGGAS